MLAAMVEAGDLPPVDERLPENPIVEIPVERTGGEELHVSIVVRERMRHEEEAPDVAGLGFASAKATGFIAGFDIRVFDEFKDHEQLLDFTNTCQRRFREYVQEAIALAGKSEGGND